MAMDFFQHQERAHKETRKLLVLYAVAVGFVVVAVYAVTALVIGGLDGVGPLATMLGSKAYRAPHGVITGWKELP